MDHFDYRDRTLHCEDVPVPELAEVYGTPLYVYSKATLLHHLGADSESLRRGRAAHLLQRQDQRQPAASASSWPSTAAASMSPAAASCTAPSRPAARATRSSSPASARPTPRSATASKTASSSSTSRARRNCSPSARSPSRMGVKAAGRPARQPRPAAQDARQDRYQRQGRQVRPRHRHGARCRQGRGRPSARSRSSACTCTSARRSSRRSRTQQGVDQGAGPDRRLPRSRGTRSST